MFDVKSLLNTITQWYLNQLHSPHPEIFLDFRIKGRPLQRLENLATRVGAPEEMAVIGRAIAVYEAIALNRDPGEFVTVYVGDKKYMDATEMFEFGDREPSLKDEGGKVIHIDAYLPKSDK